MHIFAKITKTILLCNVAVAGILPSAAAAATCHSLSVSMAEQQDTKFTSQVWNYFKLLETSSGKKTVCQLCDVKLAYQGASTKSMWNHLRAKHENKLMEKKPSQPLQSMFSSKPKQTAITSYAKGSVFSKDRKLACYLSAAEVIFSVSIFHKNMIF